LIEFQDLPGRSGWFTAAYAERSRFFQPKNAARVEAIREEISRREMDPLVRSTVLVSLMEAADRVDSTTGLQMAYLKQWAPRASNDLELRMPMVLPGEGRAFCLDASDAIDAAGKVDLVYLDPPYNQHSYLGNYHIWETLVRWDRPEMYGVAQKRVDVRTRQSAFNSRRRARSALEEVVAKITSPHIVMSSSDEGYLDVEIVQAMLRTWAGPSGRVTTEEVSHKRHIGSQIGIYSPAGKKVGEPGRKRNTEYITTASR
jgi:adenine-specific DNA-methyltransferase